MQSIGARSESISLALGPTAFQGPRILVVDDDDCSAAVVSRLLIARGYSVDVAGDPVAALNLVGRRSYGLLVLDYQMPGMNGVELYRRAISLRPQIVGILLTAYPKISTIFPAIDFWLERILAKPVDVKELFPLVEQLIGPRPRRATA